MRPAVGDSGGFGQETGGDGDVEGGLEAAVLAAPNLVLCLDRRGRDRAAGVRVPVWCPAASSVVGAQGSHGISEV